MEAHLPPKSTDRISTRVIEAIADARGVDPTDLNVPLYREIDIEALDRLCADNVRALSVTFTYDGTTVTVRSNGRIEVGETAHED